MLSSRGSANSQPRWGPAAWSRHSISSIIRPVSLNRPTRNRSKNSLRKLLDRCGLNGAVLAGGIEVAWQARHQRWLVHAHLLMHGVDENGWAQLEKAYSGSDVNDPVARDPLNDEDRQISYLVKFVTYHRPGKRRGNRPPRAYPLPAMRLAELASWWSRYRHEDFLFLYGARRRGTRIVVDRRPSMRQSLPTSPTAPTRK